MALLEDLDEAEAYLFSILQDDSGLDLAEFAWKDDGNEDGCWRAWPFQWMWYRCKEKLQIDRCARSLGKSVSIQLRGFIFPFVHPGQEMLITAPELVHLKPVTQAIEHRILSIRLSREMLDTRNRSTGFTHQPFAAQFLNGAHILGRIPQRDGRGVKGSVGAGTMIATLRGNIKAEDVQVGDFALTHNGRYMPVQYIYSYEADTVRVSGLGHRGIVVSENHRFLTSDGWQTPTVGQHWKSLTRFPTVELPDPPNGCVDVISLLALTGRWVADGNLGMRGSKAVHMAITVKDSEFDTVRKLMTEAGYRPIERNHSGSARCLVVHNTALSEWLRVNFGHRADGKFVPSWLLGAPILSRQVFLFWYLSGDGYWSNKKQRFEASTASKSLAIGLKMLANSLEMQCGLSWVDPKQSHVMGQLLKNTPMRSYRLQIVKRFDGEDGFALGRIKKVEPAEVTTVYDFVVAEDNSYVSDGLVSLGSAFLPDGTAV